MPVTSPEKPKKKRVITPEARERMRRKPDAPTLTRLGGELVGTAWIGNDRGTSAAEAREWLAQKAREGRCKIIHDGVRVLVTIEDYRNCYDLPRDPSPDPEPPLKRHLKRSARNG